MLNPRPSTPYKQLQYHPIRGWEPLAELYGHVANLVQQDALPQKDLLDKLQDWVRANPSYFVVYAMGKNTVGAVAFRMPVRNMWEPQAYRPKASM